MFCEINKKLIGFSLFTYRQTKTHSYEWVSFWWALRPLFRTILKYYAMHSTLISFLYSCYMKNLYLLLLIILFTACGVKDCEECPEWEECTMVGEVFSNKWECRSVLKKYNGRWTGTQL